MKGNGIKMDDLVFEMQKFIKEERINCGAAELLQHLFKLIQTALICNDRVEIRSFGALMTRERAGRTIDNPKNKSKSRIAPRRVVHFRASKVLLEELNAQITDQ